MKTLLIVATATLSILASNSFGFISVDAPKQAFNFKYKDLETGKILLQKTIMASSQDEAIDKGAQECFRDLRAQHMPGIDVIDICANPRS